MRQIAWLSLVLAGTARAWSPIELAWPERGAPYAIEYLNSVSSPSEAGIRRSFLSKLVDVIAGPPERSRILQRPFTIAADSHGRLAVVDTASAVVHVYEAGSNKYRSLEGPSKERLRSPVGAAWDGQGNLYISDSVLGRVFVFDRNGHFRRQIGALRGGEGQFKRPTGLAVDRANGVLYLTDTLRHRVYALDEGGQVIRQWGERGEGPGEFNFPTGVATGDGKVFVLDAMNFRVQVFTPEGKFLGAFGKPADEPGGLFRPKALAVDDERQLVYVVDAMFEVVQAFRTDGTLVFAFGHGGQGPGEFRLPGGLCLESGGRVLVADTYNGRVQRFRAVAKGTEEVGQ